MFVLASRTWARITFKISIISFGIFSCWYLTHYQYRNAWKKAAKNGPKLSKNHSKIEFLSHPLENSCKFPILHPDEPSIDGFVRHPRTILCKKVQPEFTSMDLDGFLYVHEDISDSSVTKNPHCFYRPFAGSLKPRIQRTEWTGPWTRLAKKNESEPKFLIPEDQFLVKCYHPKDKSRKRPLYKNAYAHFGDTKYRQENFIDSIKNKLSLNILVLDSVSLNQFKRNLRKSWKYMTEAMGFEWLEGYNKVGDNSMVNLFPVLAGLRYQNQSTDMISDILPHTYHKTQLDLESFDFIWTLYQKAGCVTMLNDDIGDPNRGLFHYPFNQTMGWVSPPTNYYFRPFYVSNYRWPVKNSSRLCFGNHPLSKIHLGLMESFITKFQKKCHFSFNFLTDMSHNDPNDIEVMDDDLKLFLERIFLKDQLDNSVFVPMGGTTSFFRHLLASMAP